MHRSVALGRIAGMLVAAAFLVVDRGGLLAWIGVILGSLLLLKILLWPSRRDAILSIAIPAVWAVSWVGTWAYVVSTWESGEVVQLEVADDHTARVWVLDASDGPTMYYDAPPDVADSLLAGAPVSMTRNGRVSQGCAAVSRVEEVPEERLQNLIDQMERKYENRTTATDVFYLMLGVKRDRVGLIITPGPCE